MEMMRELTDESKICSWIENYNQGIRPTVVRDHSHYSSKPTFEALMAAVEKCENHAGRRHSHQWRVAHDACIQTANNLRKSERAIRSCTSFAQLIEIVGECSVKGYAELSVYDTAVRIGAWLGIYPDYVYLHRGTRVGARMLGLPTNRQYLLISELPVPLQAVSADDAENILCIYAAHPERDGFHCGRKRRRRVTSC